MLRARLLLLPLAFPLSACESEPAAGPETALAFYDRQHGFPAGEPYVGEAVELEKVVASPDECGRGRGIDGEGKCVVLKTQELPHGGMVMIPAGAYLRGDIPLRYEGDHNREFPYIHAPGQPLREDTLPSYWIDGFEVSRRAYAECVAAGKCSEAKCLDGSDGRPPRDITEADLPNFPQTCVTHRQASDYCEYRGARLPSEGEWEFAARGPEAWMFPWGNELRDEIGQTVGPVGYDPLDISYWGLKGFGGNALEWVGDEFDPEANLRVYLRGEFRSPEGPLARAQQTHLRMVACGIGRANDPTCEVPDYGPRHVVKGGRSGGRGGAYDLPADFVLPPNPTKDSFERSRTVAQHEMLGFRCAKDLAPGDAQLTSPKPATRLPLVRQDGNYELFLGVAEAVSRSEAEAFCKQLRAPGDAAEGELGWRLPTLAEIRATYLWFAGPGPFWTAEGAAEQTFVDDKVSEWDAVAVADDAALLVRCIRDRG